MKSPNWVRSVLWIALIAFFSWLLSQRYVFIINGTATTSDIIILLIWIALIAAFIFQEVDFFGVRLKREIDNLRTEFKEQVLNLRTDIQNTNIMRAEINIGAPSSDSELRDLEKSIKPIFEKTLKEHGIDKPVPVPEELDVPDNTVFMFKVRYAIDKEIGRITNRLWIPPEERRYQSSLEKVIALSNRDIIVSAAINSIREIYAICSQAIHGEDVSKTSVKFVQEMSSPLLAYLKSIEEQPPVWWQQQPPQWLSKQWEPRQKPKKE